ncbi:MAG: bifunctional DNA-formamidopyrimidine glycosylase/DNA-(apurinic or apyrimidinic site) lyase [Chloroflexi bacterium]|nr:bifunctional DNA-formamidopyrimidine glycosylase/DNA-(apurinic or apyrimidinic site) lyase [Chloroflexota bacterium]
MPELPEVETVKNELAPHVVGQHVSNLTLFYEGIVREPSVDEFRARLVCQQITGLSRRAKYLLFHLGSGDSLIIHLKMSGALLLQTPDKLEKYIRAIIHFDGDKKLYFRDPRKFARMALVRDVTTILGGLGPEPLEPDFTPELLEELLKKRKAPIKPTLLDQEFIAGLGNMYADEALFAAKINPLRPANSLNKDEVKRLHRAIQEVLRLGITNQGASEVTFFRPSGEMGKAFWDFKVAHRRGENCPACGTPLVYMRLRGRGTYYCGKCQRG